MSMDAATVARSIPAVQPFDEANRALLANVHPLEWENPTPEGRYNLVVIGAGTAGLVTAAGAAGLGAKVALIERELMGGDCLNIGCVPSKALLRSARAAYDARNTAEFGVRVKGEVTIDFPAIMQRMRDLRAQISPNDSAERFRELGIDVFIGEGRFVGRRKIEIASATLEFSKACIATGARAFVPPIDGLDHAGYLTNETLFSLTELPKRFAIVGGGPIGCEMAQAFARFGSEVYLIEAADQILTREDKDAAQIVQTALGEDGVRFKLGCRATRVEKTATGRTVTLQSQEGTERLEIDEILIAVGRSPNVEGFGLEKARVKYDAKHGVRVNDRLRTTNRNIYAAGDVCHQYKFTHVADALARIVIRNALFFGRAKASDLVVPWCTYTDPEIAHVGMYRHEAEEAGIEVDTIQIDLADVDRAILEGETSGFLKVHLKKGSDRILGATLVSRHAGEQIPEITLAMTAGTGLAMLSDTIHPYPTQAEFFRKAGDEYNRSRLTPFVMNVFDRILSWRR